MYVTNLKSKLDVASAELNEAWVVIVYEFNIFSIINNSALLLL